MKIIHAKTLTQRVSAIVLAASVCSLSPLRAESDDALKQALDSYLHPLVERGDFSGVVLMARDGHIAVEQPYGMADAEHRIPNAPTTRFRIASISKQMTAGAVMLLQEHGKLSVDDPLSKFAPAFPRGDEITVRHLLTHKSGIPHAIPGEDELMLTESTATELMGRIATSELLFEPGEGSKYSSAGYTLLAYVIERASGRSYADFMREDIFEPLGMSNTGHDEGTVDIATGYIAAPMGEIERAPDVDMSYLMGGGSIYTTAGDLLKWDRALRDERLLSRASLDSMIANGYSLGIAERFGHRRFGFDGRLPGFICFMENYLDEDATVICLMNRSIGSLDRLRHDLSAILFGQPYDTPERPALGPPVPADLLNLYAGDFELFPGFVLSFHVEDGNLWVNDDPLDPETRESFFHRPRFARVRFVRNGNGDVDKIVWQEWPGQEWPGERVD